MAAEASGSPQPCSDPAGQSGYLPVSEHGLIGDFPTVLTYASHLGMFARQISLTGEQGNFPQALTHLALISAALNLDRALG